MGKNKVAAYCFYFIQISRAKIRTPKIYDYRNSYICFDFILSNDHKNKFKKV